MRHNDRSHVGNQGADNGIDVCGDQFLYGVQRCFSISSTILDDQLYPTTADPALFIAMLNGQLDRIAGRHPHIGHPFENIAQKADANRILSVAARK